jgi:hypothetical protein
VITATIVHPKDPRNDGSPLALVLRMPGRIESKKRAAALYTELRPYAVIGSDGEETDKVVWRRPNAPAAGSTDYEAIEWIFVDMHNAPPEATKTDLWWLFDEKWDVTETIEARGQTATMRMSFPAYALREWAKDGTFPNPTAPTSATP